MNSRLVAVVFCVALLGAPGASGHHSAAAGFTTDIVGIEGYVTEFSFTNPHVRILIEVADENGATTEWRAEGMAANTHRRSGWTANTIEEDQYLRITGRAARDGVPMILFEDIVELNPDNGAVVRNVEGESDYAEPLANVSLTLTLDDGRPNLSGDWIRGPSGGTLAAAQAPRNELGAALQAQYDPISDPSSNCEPPGLVRQVGFTPHPVRLMQNEDHVVFEYEEYAGRRVVYFDRREAPRNQHTNFGHSTASYEGDALVIETTQLLANYSNPSGQPLSDRHTTVETYRRADDPDAGPVLELELVITDPAYLTEPWTIGWQKLYSLGYEFIEVDCRTIPTYRAPE